MKRAYWVSAVYLALIVIGIPWYWPEGSATMLFGLPAWFVVTIIVSFCASVFTAFLLLRYPWHIDIESNDE